MIFIESMFIKSTDTLVHFHRNRNFRNLNRENTLSIQAHKVLHRDVFELVISQLLYNTLVQQNTGFD